MQKTLAVCAWLPLAAIAVVAQQATPPGGQQPPPVTFKVEVNYVEIDAVVTDDSGAFVRGLTKGDFEVIEEGTPQQVSTFSLVDLAIERPDPLLFREAAIEPDVRSNRGEFDGRVLVLVLDNLHTAPQRTGRVKAAARQFVERYVGANDLVAVVQTRVSDGGTQDLTGSRARLLEAIDRFVGQKLPSSALGRLGSPTDPGRDGSRLERSARGRNTLETLKNLAEFLEPIRGRRKAIVWFGEGIDVEMDDPMNPDQAVRDMLRDTIASATRAGVSFYGVDPRGLGAEHGEMIDIADAPDPSLPGLGSGALLDEVRRAQNSLRTISNETGGFAIVNQNDMRAAFERLVQDNSSYYLLGYYSTDERRDGKFRDVTMRVTRPGLHVRARKGYTAPRGSSAEPPASTPGASAAIREALGSPIPITGLTMSVFGAPFMGTAGKASIAIVAELAPGELQFVEKGGKFTGSLELVSVAVDARGKLRDGTRAEVPLDVPPNIHARIAEHGFRITQRLEVPPGRYQVRVGGRESNGQSVGALTLDLDVPDFGKALLSMSGIAIAAPSAARMLTANPDPEFKGVLPATPTAQREFLSSDVLSVFAEVYDNERTPHRVSIHTTVTGDDGAVVFSSTDERESAELAGAKGGGYGHTATIPLERLAPGRYVLTVHARTLLSNGGVAAREVEFRVR